MKKILSIIAIVVLTGCASTKEERPYNDRYEFYKDVHVAITNYFEDKR